MTLGFFARLVHGRKVDGGDASRRVGPYQLLRQVGAGGMAEVYEGRDEESGRRVAVKLLRRHLEDDEAAVARFLEEMRLTSAIRHPGLVAVEGAGVVDGTLYLATEFIEGESLEARLRRDGPLSPRAACEIASQLLEALGALHDAGVIHRDIKPANVLLAGRAEEPIVKLHDLGIATWRDETARAMRANVLTPAGHVHGHSGLCKS